MTKKVTWKDQLGKGPLRETKEIVYDDGVDPSEIKQTLMEAYDQAGIIVDTKSIELMTNLTLNEISPYYDDPDKILTSMHLAITNCLSRPKKDEVSGKICVTVDPSEFKLPTTDLVIKRFITDEPSSPFHVVNLLLACNVSEKSICSLGYTYKKIERNTMDQYFIQDANLFTGIEEEIEPYLSNMSTQELLNINQALSEDGRKIIEGDVKGFYLQNLQQCIEKQEAFKVGILNITAQILQARSYLAYKNIDGSNPNLIKLLWMRVKSIFGGKSYARVKVALQIQKNPVSAAKILEKNHKKIYGKNTETKKHQHAFRNLFPPPNPKA
ncbi:hypothetical protein MMH89_00305 [Candidatus Comchoanobacter bicostacola]|uniref:Uncharacterized protein n=1 Tax=Candidatus Comchoanobacter bicostacola TaxID=2919598 RepID=A0ABY5DLF2_9GAMM|nr:hypothetical protein [Candidatus Comchoanobacter bicostacola]UTC24607.1 hypothetical protein MMH89_00305 [Candidatus Comchoanobacter bicostacola]